VLVDGVGGLVMLPALFFVEPPSARVWTLIAVSVVVHYVYQSFVIAAYRIGDLSAVYPVARGSAPLLTALGAFLFMDERPAPIALLGIMILVGGIVAFALDGRHRRRADPAEARAFVLAIATGCTIATYTLVDAAGVRAAAGALDYIAWFYVVEAVATTTIVWIRRGRLLAPALAAGWKPGAAAALVSLGSYGLALVALRLGATAEVAALRETGVVIGALLGTLVLGEPFGQRRLVAACVVATGAVVMHMG
jgi:drug/metabolite transporter (DMT)-like permease